MFWWRVAAPLCRPTTRLITMQTRRSKRGHSPAHAANTPLKKPKKQPATKKKVIKPLKTPSTLTEHPDVIARATRIGKHLDTLYPSPAIPLTHASPFQLLVSVMLSAQTTDAKVNQVTPTLFKHAPDAAAMAKMDVTHVEGIIKEIGLAPTKSKNLCAMSAMLMELHAGEVPQEMDALELLPGVGHKTASVVVAQAFGYVAVWQGVELAHHNLTAYHTAYHNPSKPAFPVDTHIHRLAQRWGLTPVGLSVEQTEADLKALFDKDAWIRRHLQIIYFGREHCPAQKHDPTECPICSYAAVAPFNKVGSSPPRPGKKA